MALNTYAGLAEIVVPSEPTQPSAEKEPRLAIAHKKALDVAQANIDKKTRP